MNGYEIETVDRVSAVYRDMIAGIWWDQWLGAVSRTPRDA